MYLRKVLTDGNNEFLENMRVEFDYKGKHYNVQIKRLHDGFFKSYTGFCFDYNEIRNCKIGYITGEKVTVSIKALYENNFGAECGWINTEDNEKGEVGYWDLYTTDGLVCMDGETCEIIEVNEDCIVLRNTDGERDMTFTLTYAEANICCFNGSVTNFPQLEKLVGRRYANLELLKTDIEILTGKTVNGIIESESDRIEECDFMIHYKFDEFDIHTLYYLKDKAGNYYITEV